MTERKRRMRASRQKHLEHAGFKFEQRTEDGKWRVRLPIPSQSPNLAKGETGSDRAYYSKVYAHLTTAVSAAMREIERVKAMRNAKYEISKEWEATLQRFDTYEPEFK